MAAKSQALSLLQEGRFQNMRSRAKYLLIALIIFIIEVLVATIFSHFIFIRSFLGDFLVVILLYFLVKAFRQVTPLPLALAVFVFSCIVETTQYFHLADWLGLQRGNLLSILMGTNFSWVDILMYFFGCITSYFFDSLILSKTDHRPA
jgi:hypothetical protein